MIRLCEIYRCDSLVLLVVISLSWSGGARSYLRPIEDLGRTGDRTTVASADAEDNELSSTTSDSSTFVATLAINLRRWLLELELLSGVVEDPRMEIDKRKRDGLLFMGL